jgi:PHP family Zn ribbon phosphoesterase
MTTSRQYADSEGDFAEWKDHPQACNRLMTTCSKCAKPQRDREQEHPGICECGGYLTDGVCGAPVKVRVWESSDGGYEDYQYRCEAGHTWWIDGIDS